MKSSIPTATYRVQLTREFGFADCAAILPYLSSLGISTVYCSPVLQARPGSGHGYDTVDPTRLRDELGGTEGWAELLSAAKRHGLTILLDIVPNHMAASTDNPWWRDVLEHGRLSPYAGFFDIDWEPPLARLRNRVLLPILPAPLAEVIDGGEMSVELSASGLTLKCGQLELPLDVRSYRHVLTPLVATCASTLPLEFVRLARAAAALHSVRDVPASNPDLLHELRLSIKRRFVALMTPGASLPGEERVGLAAAVRRAAATLPPEGLRRVLQEQHYVLEHWKKGRHHVNYRRFFDINDLAGLRVEDAAVYELTHAFLRELAASDAVCGFRVDHIDGLRDPLGYLKRLRSIRVGAATERRGRKPYVVVEKILAKEEALPEDWPVEGTTGYDFMNEAAGLFVDASGLRILQRHYRETTRTRTVRAKLTHANKRKVLAEAFRPDLSRLASILMPAADWLYPMYELSPAQLSHAIVEATAALPVYRTYFSGRGGFSPQDRHHIHLALIWAGCRFNGDIDEVAWEVVERALTLDIPRSAPAEVRRAIEEFLLRWQQLSGAAMAKGFEDTTLYQDGAFIALNTVGSRETPEATSIERFHDWNARRLRTWPSTLNCTATHDTKRGEDVRARLTVLSEMPEEWCAAVDRWLAFFHSHAATSEFGQRVDEATHLFLLQTIIGAWPEGGEAGEFAERLRQYTVKVAREAKLRSSWLEPDEEYEAALRHAVTFPVEGEGAGRFRDCFGSVIASLRFHGLINSLARTLLKVSCPGVPDFYQGTELLDLSFVDPDNRREVDYDHRRELLAEMDDKTDDPVRPVDDLTASWPDERAKLFLVARALHFRRTHRRLFDRGDCVPLHAEGLRAEHVCSFMRRDRTTCAIVVVPVRSRKLAGDLRLPLGTAAWEDDVLRLPASIPDALVNVLTGETVVTASRHLQLHDVFAHFPVALLAPERAGGRGALPSRHRRRQIRHE